MRQSIRKITLLELINWLPVLLAITAFFVLVLRRAWLCDDAFITFRTVDNFINGHRLTWNISERVQTYTHPLWMLLLSLFYFFTREIYLTSIFLSLALSLGTVLVFALGISRSKWAAFTGVVILGFSSAFVDYSTSGLENPLSHLLLVVFLAIFFSSDRPAPRKLFFLSLTASLACVNRLDSGIIYGLPLLFYAWENKRNPRGLAMLALGQLPLVTWLLFSTLYYGFPFPNTAYAKLGHGIPSQELLAQGFYYVLHTWQRDPLTLTAIGAAFIIGILDRRKSGIMSVSIFLYLAYTIKIGGDFMGGRFFSLPLLTAVSILAVSKIKLLHSQWAVGLAATAILVGLAAPLPTYQVHKARYVDIHGISDERETYYNSTGLLRGGEFNTEPYHEWVLRGKQARKEAEEKNDRLVVRASTVGFHGYYAGPAVHIIDILALGDPLLARLPAIRYPSWRIGHFARTIPQGYFSSSYSAANLIEDLQLSEYYEKLNLIIRGNLFSSQRLEAIWKMNTGQYDHLINKDSYRYPDLILAEFKKDITPQNNIRFSYSGILIGFPDIQKTPYITIQLDPGVTFEVAYLLNDEISTSEVILVHPTESQVQKLPVPEHVRQNGFDQLRIFPLTPTADITEESSYKLFRLGIGSLN
jgi:arabinofuranosyltransferase